MGELFQMDGYATIAQAWLDGSPPRGVPSHHRQRMYASSGGNVLHSYGSHFELGRLLYVRGKVSHVLLNGERASVTTTRQQGALQRAVRDSGLPFCIIPFGALDAAGVQLDTVRIMDTSPERWEPIRHAVAWAGPDSVPDSDTRDHELQRRLADAWKLAERWAHVDMDQDRFRYNAEICRLRWHYFAAHRTETWDVNGVKVTRVTCLRGHCHACGGWQLDGACEHLARPQLYANGSALECDADGWHYVTHRHWLGASVIRADVVERKRGKCRQCAGIGTRAADRWELHRFWDGAAYAVADGKQTPFDSSDPVTCGTCAGTGRALQDYRRRQVAFLSDFDYQERRPSYFFCELPRTFKGQTVADALDALKPDAVRLAELVGRDVTRQGDIFAVPVTFTPDGEEHLRGTRGARLLGTNHEATRVRRTKDGALYARGCLYHVPDRRRPDHARQKLGDGKTWHAIVKNTVPVR